MKSHFKLLIIFLLVNFTSRAQMISLEGGICSSTINGFGLNQGGYIAPTVGVGYQYDLGKHFSLVARAMYEVKGIQESDMMVDINAMYVGPLTWNYALDYLTIPVLLRVGFGERVRFFVNAGPGFSYMLRATYHVDASDNQIGNNNSNIKDRFRHADLNVITGLGFQIHVVDQLYFSVEGRACSGMMDISKYHSDFFNETAQVLLGIGWKL